MKIKLSIGILIIAIFAALSGITIGLQRINTPDDKNTKMEAGIPVVKIDLNGMTMDEFIEGGKDVKYSGISVNITKNEGEFFYDNVSIKGRGNSTWEKPKKPFQLSFDKKIDLFGQGKSKKWVFLANYFDFSELRNDIAFYVAEMLEMPYRVPSGEYVELVINDDFFGLYYVVPKIDIAKNSVNLKNPTGILVELDNLHGTSDSCYRTKSWSCLTVKEIVDDDYTDVAMDDFRSDFEKLEDAAKKKNYEEVSKLIDVTSFVKYFLLNEFTVNPDAYVSSWYLYKDGADDLIHAGPGWDFDYALGNRNWTWNLTDEYYLPESDMVRESEARGGLIEVKGKMEERAPNLTISQVVFDLMKIPEFRDEVNRVFCETISGRKNELLSYIKRRSDYIYRAALNDDVRWGWGIYPDELEYLFDWVERRYDHFEETYGGKNINKTKPMI